MEERENIFGKCFICLTNSPDKLNVGLSLHFLCEYLKLDLKGRKEFSELSDLSVPLCPNCEKSLEKFNSLYQSLEKIKMDMEYQFELVRNLVCDESVNGYNNYWENVARLRKQILPKCLEKRMRFQPRVKIKRIFTSEMTFEKKVVKEEDSFKPSILPGSSANIKLEEVDLEISSDPEYQPDDFDVGNPLEHEDVFSHEMHINPNIKIEAVCSGINSKMSEIESSKNESEPLIESDLKCHQGGEIFNRNSSLDLQSGPHQDKKLECNICGKAYGNYGNYVKIEVNGEPMFQCNLCKTLFRRVGYFHKHYRQIHGPPTRYKCGRCGRSYSRKDKLTSHSKKCSVIDVNGKTMFQCNLCKKSYKELGNYRKHIKSAHPSLSYKCGCGRSYSRKDFLTRHRKSCYISKKSL